MIDLLSEKLRSRLDLNLCIIQRVFLTGPPDGPPRKKAYNNECCKPLNSQWSEQEDLNPRHLAPKASALPGCAMLRLGSCRKGDT